MGQNTNYLTTWFMDDLFGEIFGNFLRIYSIYDLSQYSFVDTTKSRTQSILEFIEDYDNEFETSSGGINDEINAATNLNSELYPKYYRRAMGFTVYGK